MPNHCIQAIEKSVAGKVMASWRRVFLVAHVWLTALMTLLTGFPHFRCQCPTGNVKEICLSSLFSSGDCCCAGSCCTPSPNGTTRSYEVSTARQTKRSCGCCHVTSEQNTRENHSHSQIKTPGCNRTLIQASQVLYPSQQPSNDCLVAGLPVFDLAPVFLTLPVQTESSLPPWQSYAQPPPTDLVVTLQHFLI